MKDRNIWEKRLKGLKNYKKSNKEAEDFGSKLPDSRYEAVVQGAKLADSQKGKPQIVVSCKVVDDEEYADVVQSVFMGLTDVADKEDGRAPLTFTVNTLKRLGFELSGEDPTELIDAVEELNSSKMRIKLRVNNGYANIDGPADDAGVDGDGDANEDIDDEDIPKKGKKGKDEDEEEESEEAEESSSEVTEGAQVTWDSNGTESTGTVIEILEEDNIARVEKENGKISRVPIDKLTVTGDQNDDAKVDEDEEEEKVLEDEEDEEEEVEEKPKKTTKKKKTSRR